jgi:hypothetical protein
MHPTSLMIALKTENLKEKEKYGTEEAKIL